MAGVSRGLACQFWSRGGIYLCVDVLGRRGLECLLGDEVENLPRHLGVELCRRKWQWRVLLIRGKEKAVD